MGLNGNWLIMVPAFIAGIVLVTFVFRWLWNTTLPDVFDFKKLSFGQAFKILLISIILTGGGSTLLSFTTTSTVTTGNSTESSTIKLGL